MTADALKPSQAETPWLPIADIAAAVRGGRLKASDLVEKALAAIEAASEYNAVLAMTADRARSRARQLDDQLHADGSDSSPDQPHRLPLAGVPFIAKDNFLAYGAETTAASNILKGFQAPYQASAIERLEAAGAICVAKANLDAFAHGSSTENSDFMVTKNPHDKARVPGGSSGGSAAAVILNMAPFALGTDTGGSIRLPASFCGAVGYKPTYGLVSRSGVVAMASSLDAIGPIARSVADAACVLDVLAGQDVLDSTTIPSDPAGYCLTAQSRPTNVRAAKIGVIKEYMAEGLDPDVRRQIEQAVDKLRQAGADIQEVSLPSLPAALAVYYIICPAEVSSNLSRYDGQRFGYSYADADNLEDSFSRTRAAGFGKEAKRRIMTGTYVLSSGYYDAYYKKAQTVRTKVIQEFQAAFGQVDFLLGPTAPGPAFAIGENVSDPLQMYLIDIMTVAANLAGVPAISIPAGTTAATASGRPVLPIGLQIMAAQRNDRALLELAAAAESLLAAAFKPPTADSSSPEMAP